MDFFILTLADFSLPRPRKVLLMPAQQRTTNVRRLLGGVLALATAGLTLTVAAPATAAPATITSGNGTVNSPWVPMLSAHTTCQSTGLYGNYYNGRHLDKITDLPAGTWIGVRYITSDGRSADVLWHNHGTWGFMLTSCFAFD